MKPLGQKSFHDFRETEPGDVNRGSSVARLRSGIRRHRRVTATAPCPTSDDVVAELGDKFVDATVQTVNSCLHESRAPIVHDDQASRRCQRDEQ